MSSAAGKLKIKEEDHEDKRDDDDDEDDVRNITHSHAAFEEVILTSPPHYPHPARRMRLNSTAKEKRKMTMMMVSQCAMLRYLSVALSRTLSASRALVRITFLSVPPPFRLPRTYCSVAVHSCGRINFNACAKSHSRRAEKRVLLL